MQANFPLKNDFFYFSFSLKTFHKNHLLLSFRFLNGLQCPKSRHKFPEFFSLCCLFVVLCQEYSIGFWLKNWDDHCDEFTLDDKRLSVFVCKNPKSVWNSVDWLAFVLNGFTVFLFFTIWIIYLPLNLQF